MSTASKGWIGSISCMTRCTHVEQAGDGRRWQAAACRRAAAQCAAFPHHTCCVRPHHPQLHLGGQGKGCQPHKEPALHHLGALVVTLVYCLCCYNHRSCRAMRLQAVPPPGVATWVGKPMATTQTERGTRCTTPLVLGREAHRAADHLRQLLARSPCCRRYPGITCLGWLGTTVSDPTPGCRLLGERELVIR